MNTLDLPHHLNQALAVSDDQLLPEVLRKDWEVLECLGHNGARDTLLVLSHSTHRKAVLKYYHSDENTHSMLEVISRLRHPSLPYLIAMIDLEDEIFVLWEYIEGETLWNISQDKSFDSDESIRLAVSVCDVLDYLHKQNPPIIHRDIKPENIIVRPDGSIALIDFGIARIFNEETAHDTHVMGTALFAPPEQYGFMQTDCRSDLYALGIVLAWMLTGSAQRDVFDARLTNGKFADIVRTSTAFDPENRYHSASELKAALLALLQDEQPAQKDSGKGLFRYFFMAAILLLCCSAAFFTGLRINRRASTVSEQNEQAEAVIFSDSTIEKAAHRVLGISDDTQLTFSDLQTVTGIYIFGDAIADSAEGFYTAAGNWYSSDTKAHGSITSLEDLKMMPNLRRVMIAAQHITDLTPLSDLPDLEQIEFKHNSIVDISPIKGLTKLNNIGLNDNPMTDISVLAELPNLRCLDLCDASSYDAASFEQLGDFDYLDISNRTDSWSRLGSRKVLQLKLGWTSITSLHVLSEIDSLELLEVNNTGITTLEGIEQHRNLRSLRISGCKIEDYSPLLDLPALEEVIISQEMKQNISLPNEITIRIE